MMLWSCAHARPPWQARARYRESERDGERLSESGGRLASKMGEQGTMARMRASARATRCISPTRGQPRCGSLPIQMAKGLTETTIFLLL